nr:HAMP domain-containing sensor histidine kinase [Clostridiales bacterium]
VTVPADIIALTAGRGTYSEIGNLGGVYGSSHFIVADAIMVGGRCVGLVLAVQEFSIVANPYVLAIIRMFAVSSLLALLISFITVYYMSYKFVKPLQQMSEATRKYAEGDFSYRVRLKGDDELASLAEAFNSMARDLATLEASRRSFVANVSHELKTPMTTIGGFIDGILDGTIEAEKRDSYLRLVSDEIRRLSRLVTGMLEMSKMESGEIDLKRRRFNISEQIFKTVLSFERSIQDKMIDIVGLEQIEDVFVNADEDLINQVIYNLIDNAVKFTPRGGTITLTAFLQGENAVVKVRNTGAGVSSEEIGRIFERFYKVDKSRSEDVRSAGLGLYIVKSIVELHGGNISVESVENEYTQFTFYLPVG